MNHVVTVIRPFTIQQNIEVYKDGECIKHIQTPLSNLTTTLYSICEQYDIDQVDIAGDLVWGRNIQDKFKSEINPQIQKYGQKNEIKVTLHKTYQ